MFPTSLAVYRSAFLNSDCSDGIVARPHTEFTKGEKSKKVLVQVNLCIIAPATEQYSNRCRIEGEVLLLGNKSKSIWCMYV